METTVKGYKVFNSDFTCRSFQYKVGQTYKHQGRIELCGSGFHFCNKLADCFGYYDFDPDNKVAEIEAVGKVSEGNDKSVTDEIKIVREITWNEVLELVNTGKGNTGLNNSGNKNSGNRNSGNKNSGNRNSGMFNSCDHANGLFNSKSPKIYMFNKPTKLTYEEFQEKHSEGYSLLRYPGIYLNEWVFASDMTDEEKKQYPKYEATNGYLRTIDYKVACQKMWDNFSDKQKKAVKKLPNFDKDVFKDITGIEV